MTLLQDIDNTIIMANQPLEVFTQGGLAIYMYHLDLGLQCYFRQIDHMKAKYHYLPQLLNQLFH